MAPSVTIENEMDFDIASSSAKTSSSNPRTLLLAPPSIASHGEGLQAIFASHDRSVTDLQMLDRLSAGLAVLPDSTYDLILLLTGADGTRSESSQLLGRDVFSRIFKALKAGGALQTQDGAFGQNAASGELREAILAGLVADGDRMIKPLYNASDAVPLKLLRRKDKNGAAASSAGPAVVAVPTIPTISHGKRKSVDMTQSKPVGVGFVDFSDDLETTVDEEDDDDELIDEDTLLTEEDLRRPVNIRKISPSDIRYSN